MLCHFIGWTYALANVIVSFIVEDVKQHGQMLSIFLSFGRCYCHFILLWQLVWHCITCFNFENGRCYCHVARWNSHFYIVKRWQMLLPSGRWNYHSEWVMALAGCYNQVGRWNSHRVYFRMLSLVLRCYAEPHPRCVAGGICLCFYSGMDYWPECRELLWWFSLGSGPCPTMLELSMLTKWPVMLQWS